MSNKHKNSKSAQRKANLGANVVLAGDRTTRPTVGLARQGGLRMVAPGSVGNTTTFPNRLKKTLVTNGTFTLTGDGIGSIQRYSLSLNSLYDPDYGGGGNSPRYYDTLVGADSSTAPYGKYSVERARLKVSFLNSSAANTSICDVGVAVRSDEMAPINTISELYESINAVAVPLGSGYSGNGIVEFAFEVDAKKMASLQSQKDILDDADNIAWYNADPATEVLADVMMRPLLSSSTNAVYVRWTIEMDAVLYCLNEVATSLVRRVIPKADKWRAVLPNHTPDKSQRHYEGHPVGCYCTKCRPC